MRSGRNGRSGRGGQSTIGNPQSTIRNLQSAIVAALLFVAVGALAAEESPARLVCVRNRALVPVALNDVEPYYMLLDLALPRPVLSSEVVDYLKLEVMPGEMAGSRLVRLQSFQCGGRPATSKTCVILNLAPLCGLLGATVAGIVNPREFGAEIVLDIGRGGFMAHGTVDAVLHDEKDPRTVKMSMTDDLPTVPTLLNGTTQRSCALDTTFGGTLALSEALLAELGVALDAAPKLVARSVPGVADDPVGRIQIRLKSVRVGTAEVRDPLCAVEPGNKPARLGVGFLKHFRATLNFDRGLVRWETEAASPPCDEPVIGCGLGLASFQGGHWTVWIALNSPADREGIPPGSALLAIDGKDMEGASYADAFAALPSTEGKEVEVTFSHGTESRTVALKAVDLMQPGSQ